MKKSASHVVLGAIVAACASGVAVPALAIWEPVRPVEFIVPAGTGGGADQMARTIQGIT
jgi:putative tricarboxylic transport membrane protein